MKNIVIIILQIVTISNIGFCQWVDKRISTDQTLTSVDFLNAEIGYVTGSNKIFKTIDGGDSWIDSHTSDELVFFEDIFLINKDIIMAVGKDFNANQSIIAKTNDGGNSWSQTVLPSSSLLSSIFFASENIGYCSGGIGTIFKTTDGGNTWKKLETGVSNTLLSIYFVNDTIGIAVGGGPSVGVIIKTEDGGNTWNIIDSPSQNYLQSVFFTNQQIGYAVGWKGEILKTKDCGSTWIFQNSISMDGNLEITFTDSNVGYITGGSQINQRPLIQKTSNAGETWVDISPDGNNALICINFPTLNTGYAVGSNGSVFKTDSGGISYVNNLFHNQIQIDVFPNPTNSFLYLKASEDKIINNIKMYNRNGSLIKEFHDLNQIHNLDLTEFTPNIYFLEIQTENEKIIKKIIKN